MKNRKNYVSIIMNCHNGERFLSESLDSVIKQSFKNWELIFYDNRSLDNSKKIFKSFKDKRFKYFKSKKFLKLYAARNEAIKKTKGAYICFLDTDDTWHRNKLKYQIKYFKNKKCKILYSKFFIKNLTDQKTYLNYTNNLPFGNITKALLSNYKIGILTCMIEKNIFKKHKFNSNYQIIGDFDFFLNLSLKYYIFSLNKPLACYKHHSKNLSSSRLDLYLTELYRWLKINKNKYSKFNLISVRILIVKIALKLILKKIKGCFF